MKRVAVIVAGGKGVRMGGELPKQYLRIGNRPILMRTLEAFHRFDLSMELILVIPQSHHSYWQTLCAEEQFTISHTVVYGGATRFQSVKNGLSRIESPCMVAIHDGVRPFVSPALLQRCFDGAEQHGALLPAIPVVETIRETDDWGGSLTVDRSRFRLVQTPQVFRSELLIRAYSQPFNEKFTDDASVVEAAGFTVTLVEGERENIKITTPIDLEISECLSQRWKF